ncbi:hypothetical protein ABTZ03_09470 [Kitasatospora sp. NPDC096077]|uniref:hypothetical protein n=1 Tax=Kitasatospora sp. NPDC096077 TaxID=3155544 RepID=UPI0033327BF5
MERIRVGRCKALFRQADHLYRRADLRLEGVRGLLAQPERRRARLLPLAREQWLLAVADDPDVALVALADAVTDGLDLATDEFVDQAVVRWLDQGWPYRLREETYERLQETLATTGRPLAERMTSVYRARKPGPLDTRREEPVIRMLLTYHPVRPPMDVLLAIGPLRTEADWWCDVGYAALDDDDHPDLAGRHFARADELGSPHARERAAYLALLRTEGTSDRESVRSALVTARELYPSPDPERRLYLGCRAVFEGLETDLGELAELRVDRPDLRDFWVAQHHLRTDAPAEARAWLRSSVERAGPVFSADVHRRRPRDRSPFEVRDVAEAQLARLEGREPASWASWREHDDPDASFLPVLQRWDPGWLYRSAPVPEEALEGTQDEAPGDRPPGPPTA